MDISGMGSYAEYLSSSAASQASNAAWNNQIEQVKNSQDPEALLDACKQFEAYLWEQVYKAMEKSIDAFKSDDEKSGYASNMVQYFQEGTIQEIATRTTQENGGANSLAQSLYEQMKRNYGITD